MKYLWFPLIAFMAFNANAADPFQKEMDVNTVVLFDHDSSVVSTDEKHRINHVFEAVPKTAMYELSGNASHSGSVKYNIALSLRRAVAVSDALGKPNAKLVANGKEFAKIHSSRAAERADRNVDVHAIWSTYKPTFGFTTFLVPGPLFHLQGHEPGLQGTGVGGGITGAKIGI